MRIIQILLIDRGQISHLGVAGDPDTALHGHVAAILAYTVHIVIQAAQQFTFKLKHSVTLGRVTEPSFLHLESSFVGQSEKVDSSHLHLEDDSAVVLLHADALKVLNRFLLLASILCDELLYDILGHEQKVDSLSEALLDLVILPLELDRNIGDLVVFLFQKELAEINTPRRL